MTELRAGTATDVGRVRMANEDLALEAANLFAVADGMGGHAGGEVAARTAVDTLRSAFTPSPSMEGLRRAINEANREVWRQSQARQDLRGMGTTITAAALVSRDGGDALALANVGDSRAYVFSGDRLIQVTADHSVAEEKVRNGELTPEQAAVHPHRHILTRALGVSSDVDVDLWELHLRSGDRLLLCSDGLTNEVDEEEIAELLRVVEDPEAAARALVQAANEHGGNDNITVLVVDIVSGEKKDTTLPLVTPIAGTNGAGDATAVTPLLPDSDHDATGGAGDSASENELGITGALPVVSEPKSGASDGATSVPLSRAMAATAAAPSAAAGGETAAPSVETGTVLSDREGDTQAQLSKRQRRRLAGISRRVTLRVLLFLAVVAAVVAAAYLLVQWYATDNWYVTIDQGRLVVYQGRPGGMLWVQPKAVDRSAVTSSEVLPIRIPALRATVTEPSLDKARQYIANLHQEYLDQKWIGAGGTTPPTTTTAPSGSSRVAAGVPRSAHSEAG